MADILQVRLKYQCPARNRFTGRERLEHDLITVKMPERIWRQLAKKAPTHCQCGRELDFEGHQAEWFLS
jgi:hypothetical protein